MATIEIIALENNNRVIDRTPRIRWQLVDSISGHAQTSYRISIYDTIRLKYITPENTPDYSYSGVDYAEYSISNKDPAGACYHDIVNPLLAGVYTVYIMGKETGGNWTEPVSAQFTVIKYQENIIRFSKNNLDDTMSFSKYFATANIDITTNPERARLSINKDTVYKDGFAVLETDGGYAGILWDSLTYSSSLPDGTSLSMRVKAADVQADLDTTEWSNSISSGADLVYPNQVNLTGRYIRISVDITTDISKTATPVLNYLTLNYTLPATTGAILTKTLDNFTVVDTTISESLVNTIVNGSNDIELKSDPTKTISIYYEEGYIELQVAVDVPVTFKYLAVDEVIMSDSDITYQYKAFSDLENEYPLMSWSPAVASDGGLVTIDAEEVTYLYIRINFARSTDTYDTSRLKTLYLVWEQYLKPGICYFYSFNYLLKSNLKKIIVSANDNIKDTKNCKIQYGICCTNATDNFESYQPIDKNRLIETISLPGKSVRIGAKMASGSLIFLPIIDDLGFILEDVDANQYYFNK